MSKLDPLQRMVAAACRILGMMGLVDEITGHVSARIPGREAMWLRCRGDEEKGVRYTIPWQVHEVSWAGTLVDQNLPADARPLEWPLHAEIYRALPHVGGVVHAHPPGGLWCGLADLEIRPMRAYDEVAIWIGLEGVPVFPSAQLIETPELGRQLAQVIGHHHVCLLRGHGIVAVGASVEEATLYALKFEKLAQANWQMRLAGIRPTMSEADLEHFRCRMQGQHGLPRRELWTWHYYLHRLRAVDGEEVSSWL